MNHRMAIAASFHRNVLLLNQLVPPSDDFKKVFREVIISSSLSALYVKFLCSFLL